MNFVGLVFIQVQEIRTENRYNYNIWEDYDE